MVLDDKEDTIEEEIENSSPDVAPPDSTRVDGKKTNKNETLNINEYPEHIPFSASLKKRTEKEKEETAHFNQATGKKEESNSHTFGARSKLGEGPG